MTSLHHGHNSEADLSLLYIVPRISSKHCRRATDLRLASDLSTVSLSQQGSQIILGFIEVGIMMTVCCWPAGGPPAGGPGCSLRGHGEILDSACENHDTVAVTTFSQARAESRSAAHPAAAPAWQALALAACATAAAEAQARHYYRS